MTNELRQSDKWKWIKWREWMNKIAGQWMDQNDTFRHWTDECQLSRYLPLSSSVLSHELKRSALRLVVVGLNVCYINRAVSSVQLDKSNSECGIWSSAVVSPAISSNQQSEKCVGGDWGSSLSSSSSASQARGWSFIKVFLLFLAQEEDGPRKHAKNRLLAASCRPSTLSLTLHFMLIVFLAVNSFCSCLWWCQLWAATAYYYVFRFVH